MLSRVIALDREVEGRSCAQMSWRQKDRTKDETVKVRRAHRGLHHGEHPGPISTSSHLPLDFNSAVHKCSNSTTSSGSILVRTQASDHWGFLCESPFARGAVFFLSWLSLLLNTFEKNGMVRIRASVAVQRVFVIPSHLLDRSVLIPPQCRQDLDECRHKICGMR